MPGNSNPVGSASDTYGLKITCSGDMRPTYHSIPTRPTSKKGDQDWDQVCVIHSGFHTANGWHHRMLDQPSNYLGSKAIIPQKGTGAVLQKMWLRPLNKAWEERTHGPPNQSMGAEWLLFGHSRCSTRNVSLPIHKPLLLKAASPQGVFSCHWAWQRFQWTSYRCHNSSWNSLCLGIYRISHCRYNWPKLAGRGLAAFTETHCNCEQSVHPS